MTTKAALKKQNQIRYNLYLEIRKEGYKLNTRKRTIYVFYKNIYFTKNVLRLRNEFGYSIQTELAKPINP